jgi:hypothetical protein
MGENGKIFSKPVSGKFLLAHYVASCSTGAQPKSSKHYIKLLLVVFLLSFVGFIAWTMV